MTLRLKSISSTVRPMEARVFGALTDGAVRDPVKRITGRRLQEIRQRHFRLKPLCVRCELAGRVRAATQLDHIVALVNGGEDTDRNRQGLCYPCHVEKTAEDMLVRRALTEGQAGRPWRPAVPAGTGGGGSNLAGRTVETAAPTNGGVFFLVKGAARG